MYKCKRCNFEWLPRVENPKACPNCNSRLWKKDRATNKEITK